MAYLSSSFSLLLLFVVINGINANTQPGTRRDILELHLVEVNVLVPDPLPVGPLALLEYRVSVDDLVAFLSVIQTCIHLDLRTVRIIQQCTNSQYLLVQLCTYIRICPIHVHTYVYTYSMHSMHVLLLTLTSFLMCKLVALTILHENFSCISHSDMLPTQTKYVHTYVHSTVRYICTYVCGTYVHMYAVQSGMYAHTYVHKYI